MGPKARVILYGFVASPPWRATALTCEALGVEWVLKPLDVTKMDHHKPDYLKLNPIHSIPTMVDGDYILFDSHAISAYLANSYAKDDKWYPKEPKLRGIVDQRLYYNNSVLGPAFKKYGVPFLFNQIPTKESITEVKKAMEGLDKLLGDSQFIALSWPTIADCHCAATVFSIQLMLPQTVTHRISAWLKRCAVTLPGYSKVQEPAAKQLKMLMNASSKL